MDRFANVKRFSLAPISAKCFRQRDQAIRMFDAGHGEWFHELSSAFFGRWDFSRSSNQSVIFNSNFDRNDRHDDNLSAKAKSSEVVL
jgi:hypothetical protein